VVGARRQRSLSPMGLDRRGYFVTSVKGSLGKHLKNVKIITIDGVVTLRGPVETEKEKAAIESHAKHGGAKKITNELEIKKS
jgi:BON domain